LKYTTQPPSCPLLKIGGQGKEEKAEIQEELRCRKAELRRANRQR
jgi:hypothetical protein